MGRDDPNRCLLSKGKILEHMKKGDIIIDPYNPENLKTTSYDVRLGNIIFREQHIITDKTFFNPLDEEHVKKYWGEPEKAILAGEWIKKSGVCLRNIKDSDYIIVINPQETILAHTIEFIGGQNCVSTEMRARSSMGRIGLTVCKCAGWGDIGYFNRWTMEMTNHLVGLSLILPVGLRVAQIIFYKVDPIKQETYVGNGKYQGSNQLKKIKRTWTPESMLPKLFKDKDIGKF